MEDTSLLRIKDKLIMPIYIKIYFSNKIISDKFVLKIGVLLLWLSLLNKNIL